MPGRLEDTDELDAANVAASDVTSGDSAANLAAHPRRDRFPWCRHIGSKPRQLRVYRVVVAIAGLLLIVLGLVTGPIPGPGGIPLILLGLATWASEFAWAHRLMHWFKLQLHRFQQWTRWQQVGFWVAFVAFCGLCGYSLMVVAGVPPWVPTSAEVLLQRLPGL